MKEKVPATSFPDIVRIYNEEGRRTAYRYLSENFGLKNPYTVVKRIRESGQYTYNRENDKYEPATFKDAESLFMSMDELCGVPAPTKIPTVQETSAQQTTAVRSAAMEALVRELISDRLLILSKYVTIDSATMTVLLDSTSLRADGYQLITH